MTIDNENKTCHAVIILIKCRLLLMRIHIMSRLTDLALKDAEECLSKTTMVHYQVKINIESTLRGLQEECSMLHGLVDMLKVKGEDDKDAELKNKALDKINKSVDINRKLYTENIKALSQIEEAISAVNRADRWLGAVAEDLKK